MLGPSIIQEKLLYNNKLTTNPSKSQACGAMVKTYGYIIGGHGFNPPVGILDHANNYKFK
jgi:hypothetical protein